MEFDAVGATSAPVRGGLANMKLLFAAAPSSTLYRVFQ
jgi:hypothetical protein